MKRSRWLLALAVAAPPTCVAAGLLAVPFTVLGAGGMDDAQAPCQPLGPRAGPQAPTILGPASASATDLERWRETVDASSRGVGTAGRADMAMLYITEGSDEGVRGDIAFAQAVLETGYFTSRDAANNNFAGIAHYDGRSAGQRFRDPATGVRAHVQLLKKYAAGNTATLAHPDVAPDAGAQATTWADLAGTWASAPDYWESISHIYNDILTVSGVEGPQAADGSPGVTAGCKPVAATNSPPRTPTDGSAVPLVTVDEITVNQSIADRLAQLLAASRRDGINLAGWGYRSHERQIELRREHCGTTNYAIYEMPSSQCSPPTARPGSSMHEQGLAVDFTCDGRSITSHANPCYEWLAANASSFGLFNLPSESWHWSVDGT